MLDNLDTTIIDKKVRLLSSKSFLVYGYKNNSLSDNAIDSFANNVYSHRNEELAQLTLFFYKKSKNTNIENLKRNIRIVDRYSNEHDLLFMYVWSDGKLISRYKFKKGQIIRPKTKILIENIRQ
jgi:hypothetical protein